MAKQSKSPKKGKSKSSFGSNLSNSLKSLAGATTRDLMPNLTRSIKSNTAYVKTVYNNVYDKIKETDIKQNYIYKSGNNIIKNSLNDIKTGNIYNSQRQKKNSDDPFAQLLNFDFSDAGIDSSFSGNGDNEESTAGGNEAGNSFNAQDFSLDLDVDTKSDIKSMANFSQTNVKISNRGFAVLSTQLASISAFQNKNTLKFYESVEEKLASMEHHLSISSAYYKDLSENSSKSSRQDSAAEGRSLENAYNMKGFNLEDYTDIYKKNVQDMLGAGSMIGSMMIKPMVTDFVNNPIGSMAKWGIKSLIPKGIKSSLGDLDKTFGMLPMYLQSKIPGMKKKGGMSALFAEMLDLNKNRVKAGSNKYAKGPISFDGMTKRSITHVIPGYLKRILFALTGDQKDNLIYDHDKGKFVTEQAVKSMYRDRIQATTRDSIDDNMTGLEKKYVQSLIKKKVIKKDSDASQYIEEFRKNMANLSKSGKSLSSDLDISDLSKDKKQANILKDVIKALNMKDLNESNKALNEAYLAYQSGLRDMTSQDTWHQAYDNGSYSNKDSRRNKANTKGMLDGEHAKNLEKAKKQVEDTALFKKFKGSKLYTKMKGFKESNENGGNSVIDKIVDTHLNSKIKPGNYTDNGNFKTRKKGKNTGNRSILGELTNLSGSNKSDLAKTVNVTKSLLKGANIGLLQYATTSNEGLALRVKVVGSGNVGTIPSILDFGNDKSDLARKKRSLKIMKASSTAEAKEETIQDKKKLAKNKKKKKRQSYRLNKRERDKEEKEKEKGSGLGSMFGDLFRDITGQDFSKESIKGILKDKIEGAKYGSGALLGLKYAKKGLAAFNKTKIGGAVSGKVKDIFNTGLGSSIKNRGVQAKDYLKTTGKDFGLKMGKGFINRTGMDKDFVLGKLAGGINGIGGAAAGILGGAGKIISGDMSVKDGIKGLWKGGNSARKGLWAQAKGGLGRLDNLRKGEDGKKTGYLSLIKSGFKGVGKGGKAGFGKLKDLWRGKKDPTADISVTANGKIIDINADKGKPNTINIELTPLENSLKNMTSTVDSNLSNINDTIKDTTDVIGKDSNKIGSTTDNKSAIDKDGNPIGKRTRLQKLTDSGQNAIQNVKDKIENIKDGINTGKDILGKGKTLLKGPGKLGRIKSAVSGLGGGKVGKVAGAVGKFGKGALGKAAGFAGRFAGLGGAAAGVGEAGAAAGGLAGLGGAGLAAGEVAGTAAAAGGGLAGAGGLAGLAGLAGPALLAAAPVLAGVAGVAAAGYGVKKLFDWGKKRKEEKKQKALLAASSGTAKKGLFGGLFDKKAESVSPVGVVKNAKEDPTSATSKTAEYLKPFGTFLKSASFTNIFGGSGLFSSMFQGVKDAAGGGMSKLKGFFSNFWKSTSGKGSETDSGSTTVLGGGSATGSKWDQIFKFTSTGESNNDPGVVSTGANDAGGVSYGAFQLSTNSGAADSFAKWMAGSADSKAAKYGAALSKSKAGTAAFTTEWKAIAKEDPTGFMALQKQRVKEEYYDKGVSTIQSAVPGFDPTKHSTAVNALILSTAAQFGPYTKLWSQIFGKNTKDVDIIKAFKTVRTAAFPATASRYATEYTNAMAMETSDPSAFGTGLDAVAGAAGSSSAKVTTALKTAKAMIDAKYPYSEVSNANDPSSGHFDCSGLVQYSYKKAGISLPRTTYDQVKSGTGVAIAGTNGVSNALPGDLLFARPGSRGPEHVMMYAGNNMVLEASSKSTGLVNRSVVSTSFKTQPVAIRRIVGASGLPQGSGPTAKLSLAKTDSLIKAYSAFNGPADNSYKGLPQGDIAVATANNSKFRDEDRNSLMLKLKDVLDTISANTGETNNILNKMLQSMLSSVSNGVAPSNPLSITPEMMSLFNGS